MQLNETGELKRLLVGFEERPNEDCSTCGGVGFVNCTWCRGKLRRCADTAPPPKNPLRALCPGALATNP